MKKALFVILCLLVASGAFAQDVKDRTAYIYNIDRSLWYNSSSVAGLARDDIAQWRNIQASYDLQNGKFTDSWGSESAMGLTMNGDMLMELGTLKVLAGLSLERNFLGKSRYNTGLYSVSWDMPYYTAINANTSFLWRQSHASVNVGVVSPLMINDMLSAGIGFSMDLLGASKSAVPQCRYRGLDLAVTPSVTVAVNEDNIVGLSVNFRTKPSRSILTSDEPNTTALFLQGLGEYSVRWVGGEIGMAPLDYNTRVIGAALQYNHLGGSSEWLLEASLDSWDTSVTENDVRLGKVAKYVTGFTATGLFGDKLNRKLTLDLKYNLNYWIPSVSTRPVANNSIIDGNINYTVYTGAYESGFNWRLGLGMDIAMLRLKRINPVSKLTSNNVLPYAFLGKDISISKEHSLLARLKLGYNFSAGNEFNYRGDSAEGNYIVNYMLDDEMDYLSSYYLSTTLNLDYTYRMNDRLSAYASISGGLLSPMDRNTSRFILQLSLGTLF